MRVALDLLTRAPARVAANARRVRLIVASDAPAILTIAGAHHHVDRKPRAITIPVHPGHTTLHLRYTLSAQGGTTHLTYTLAR